MNLTPLQVLSLAKLLTKQQIDEARSLVPAGSYSVDVVISASVDLTKGEDHERVATARVPTKALISVLLGKLNAATGTSAMALLEEALAEAHELGDSSAASAVLEGDTSFAKGLKILNAAVAKAAPIPVQGRIVAKNRQAVALDTAALTEADTAALSTLLAASS